MQPPQATVDISLSNPQAAHEQLVNVFGRWMMWCRDSSLSRSRLLIESRSEREKLARLVRAPYELSAALDAKQKDAAVALAEATVDRFAKMLLTLLTSEGDDQRAGSFSVRFKLIAELADATGAVVREECINRNGEKVFFEYWGRWLNLDADS